jgi:bacillithiol biosynthesis deacetylase BshB1
MSTRPSLDALASPTALFVGPHPDDIELFAGGTAARLARLGHRVILCDLTRGEHASRGTPERRAEEAEQARVALGAAVRVQLGLRDAALCATDDDAAAALVACIREYRPSVLFAPARHARHPDHEAAAALCRRAAFLAGLARTTPGVPHHVSLLAHYTMRVAQRASFVVPLREEDLAAKRAAIAAYASQLAAPDDHTAERPQTLVGAAGFVDVLAARDRTVGATVGAPGGEAFVSERIIALSDPVAWATEHAATDVHWFTEAPE